MPNPDLTPPFAHFCSHAKRRSVAFILRFPFEQALTPAATSARPLIIIGIDGRALIVDEVGGIEGRGNCPEGDRGLGKVETIGEVVGLGVRIAQRWQIEISLDEFQDAAEVMRGVRNIGGFGVG